MASSGTGIVGGHPKLVDREQTPHLAGARCVRFVSIDDKIVNRDRRRRSEARTRV